MAITPHICGQHLSGEALVGYAVGPDSAVMGKPKLTLRGGAAQVPLAQVGAPLLILHGGTASLFISSTASVGVPRLLLLAREAVGKELGIFPSPPDPVIVYPTVEEDWLLIPTTDSDLLLVPTVEEDL